jgi:hypothetical protein
LYLQEFIGWGKERGGGARERERVECERYKGAAVEGEERGKIRKKERKRRKSGVDRNAEGNENSGLEMNLKNLFCGRAEDEGYIKTRKKREEKKERKKNTQKRKKKTCAHNFQPARVHKIKRQQVNPQGTPLRTKWAGFDSQRVLFYQKRIHPVDCCL